jgi:hypothetical protein
MCSTAATRVFPHDHLVLLLLGVMAGAALASVLLPLPLAMGVAENGPYRLLAGGKVGGNIQELLGSAWTLVS